MIEWLSFIRFKVRISVLGCMVQGLAFTVSGFRGWALRVPSLKFRVKCLEFRHQGHTYRIEFGVERLGFRI
jgi:hypothetical protein